MVNYRIYTRTEKSVSFRHRVNEDRHLFAEFSFMEDEKIGLLLVADGMGGLSDGDQAAQNAVLRFSGAFYERLAETYVAENMEGFSMSYFADRMEEIMRASMEAANREVCEKAQACIETGTTLSAVAIAGRYAVAANVGDSPVYLYRAGTRELKLVSRLQTKAQLDVEAGKYQPYSADYYENDHYLYLSLGAHSMLDEEDIYVNIIGGLENGDMFLLGSDGAFGRLLECEIQELLEEQPLEQERLILPRLFALARADRADDQTAILYVVCGEEET